jgi:ribosomal protein S18
MWRIDPILGNDRETNNKKRAVAIQQILNKQHINYKNTVTLRNFLFCVVLVEIL